MKFWELTSVFRSDRGTLAEVFDNFGGSFSGWLNDNEQLVGSQNREILDAEMPDELCVKAMSKLTYRFKVKDGFMYLANSIETGEGTLRALEAYSLVGGSGIEDVLEKSSVEIPLMPH